MKYLVFVTVVFILGFVLGCSEPADTPIGTSEESATSEQIQKKLNELAYTVQLADFDYLACSPHSKGAAQNYRYDWNLAQKITQGNEVAWDLPVYTSYTTAIVAGRKAGNFLKPMIVPVGQRILLKQNEKTGEVSAEVLTLIGSNVNEVNSTNLQNLQGFAIVSDLSGKESVTYQVEQGVIKKILAGNEELKHQDADFYCFCFQEAERLVVRTRGEDLPETGPSIEICSSCMNWMENCTCKRCPECKSLVENCSCATCHICHLIESECQCGEKCSDCFQYKWNCKCPKIPSVTPEPPSAITCSQCGKQHSGDCETSVVTPQEGKCHNIYCIGGERCSCKQIACTCCRGGACNCPPKVTS